MFVIEFIQNGGFFMYPILLILFLGMGIVIERALYLAKWSVVISWSGMMFILFCPKVS